MQSTQSPDESRGTVAGSDRPGVAPLPDGVTSPRAKLVLLFLRVEVEARAEEIARTLGLTRLSLYPVLDALVAAGHVERLGDAYVAR